MRSNPTNNQSTYSSCSQFLNLNWQSLSLTTASRYLPSPSSRSTMSTLNLIKSWKVTISNSMSKVSKGLLVISILTFLQRQILWSWLSTLGIWALGQDEVRVDQLVVLFLDNIDQLACLRIAAVALEDYLARLVVLLLALQRPESNIERELPCALQYFQLVEDMLGSRQPENVGKPRGEGHVLLLPVQVLAVHLVQEELGQEGKQPLVHLNQLVRNLYRQLDKFLAVGAVGSRLSLGVDRYDANSSPLSLQPFEPGLGLLLLLLSLPTGRLPSELADNFVGKKFPEVDFHSDGCAFGFRGIGGKATDRLFDDLQKIFVVEVLLHGLPLDLSGGVLPLGEITVPDHPQPFGDRSSLVLHLDVDDISLLIVVPHLENVVVVKVLEALEVAVPEGLALDIVFLVELIHLVGKTNSFLAVVQDVVVAGKGSLVVLRVDNGIAGILPPEVGSQPLHHSVVLPVDVDVAVVADFVQGRGFLGLVEEVLGHFVLSVADGGVRVVADEPGFGLQGQVDPAVVDEEEQVADGVAGVPHEVHHVVVAPVVDILHAVLAGVVVGRHVAGHEVGVRLQQGPGVLVVGHRQVVGVCVVPVLGRQPGLLICRYPLHVVLLAAEHGVHLVLLHCLPDHRGVRLLQLVVVDVRVLSSHVRYNFLDPKLPPEVDREVFLDVLSGSDFPGKDAPLDVGQVGVPLPEVGHAFEISGKLPPSKPPSPEVEVPAVVLIHQVAESVKRIKFVGRPFFQLRGDVHRPGVVCRVPVVQGHRGNGISQFRLLLVSTQDAFVLTEEVVEKFLVGVVQEPQPLRQLRNSPSQDLVGIVESQLNTDHEVAMIVGEDGVPVLAGGLVRADELVVHVGGTGGNDVPSSIQHVVSPQVVGLGWGKNLEHPQAVEEPLALSRGQRPVILAHLCCKLHVFQQILNTHLNQPRIYLRQDTSATLYEKQGGTRPQILSKEKMPESSTEIHTTACFNLFSYGKLSILHQFCPADRCRSIPKIR